MTDQTRTRLVVVAQSFPPVGGSHATRTAALCKGLTRRFDVVGVGPRIGRAYPNLDYSTDLGIDVVRSFPGLAHHVAHGMGRGSNPSSAERRSRGSAFKRVLRVFVKAYRALEVVDSYFDWVPHLAQAVRRETKNRHTVVLSLSMPNSVHVATWLGLLGRSNTWIADFADPWTLDASRQQIGVRRRFEDWLEGLILRRANRITFVTERTARDYVTRYPFLTAKVDVVRMGFDRDDERVEPMRFDRPTIFYGGALPPENRDPSNLLACIGAFPTVDFIFAGPCVRTVTEHYSGSVPENVRRVPWLNHKEYVAHVKGAELCLILGNSNAQQVPGKVYHSLRFARRVLYVARLPEADDEARRILGVRAIVANDSVQAISDAIERGLVSREAGKACGEGFSWLAITGRFGDIVEEAISANNHA